MAEGVTNRRRLASQMSLIKPTVEKSEVVLNELTVNQMRIKTCFLRYQPEEETNKRTTRNPRNKRKI
jgi:hypothetical protein